MAAWFLQLIIGFAVGVASAAWLKWSAKTRARIVGVTAAGIAVAFLGDALIDAYSSWRRDRAIATLEVSFKARGPGEKLWSAETYARPGDTIEYLLTIKNAGPGRAPNLLARVSAAPRQHYICNSLFLRNSTNPDGRQLFGLRRERCPGKHLHSSGYDIGHYEPGAIAHIYWKARLSPTLSGASSLRSVGVSRARGKTNQVYNVAVVRVPTRGH